LEKNDGGSCNGEAIHFESPCCENDDHTPCPNPPCRGQNQGKLKKKLLSFKINGKHSNAEENFYPMINYIKLFYLLKLFSIAQNKIEIWNAIYFMTWAPIVP